MNTSPEMPQHNHEDTLDAVLRQELHWQAPPELTACLLGLVQQQAQPAAPPRPKTWYTVLVMLLTTLAVGLSLAVAWQIYGVVSAELGLAQLWQQVQLWPTMLLSWLDAQVPALGFVLTLLTRVQEQVHWIIVAIVLWLALDSRPPQTAQQQVSS
jgi:hypothetical protein